MLKRRALLGLAKGLSLQQVADREGITLQYPKTNTLPSLYRKLRASNAAEAVAQGFVKRYIIR